MGPGRRHATTAFLDFTPGPLSGYGAPKPKLGNAPILGSSPSFPLRIGVLSAVSCLALALGVVGSNVVVGLLFGGFVVLGCVVAGQRLWSTAGPKKEGP